MLFNGINFYEAHWKEKSEAEFIEHESHHGLSKAQLKEAWKLMNPKKQKDDDKGAVQQSEKV